MTFQTKYDINKFTRKLYRFLEEDHKIIFKRFRTNRGYVWYNTTPSRIWLDPADLIIPTLIHEVLHYFYPEASESKVCKMEKTIINKLSDRQIKNIIKKLAQKL